MLRLHFINVGDGDSILVEDTQADFRLLVDTGKPDAEPCPESDRLTALDYLREQGIDHLNAVLITHLHADHAGGLRLIAPAIRVDDLYAGYYPKNVFKRAYAAPNAVKTVRGLTECINDWAGNVYLAEQHGAKRHLLRGRKVSIRWTENLTCDISRVSVFKSWLQSAVLDAMFAGVKLPGKLLYWASKYRNPGSLRMRLHYAGREIELSADCYGFLWEKEKLTPCDIWKIPHHGDNKAITPKLAEKLRPQYCVVSCGREYIPKKDRPSPKTLSVLDGFSRVLFTDNYEDSTHEAIRHRAVLFHILEDGTIASPEKTMTAGG